MLRLSCALASLALVAACASPPTDDQVRAADTGPYPSSYEQIVKANFATSLFDPYSAVFTFTRAPTKGYGGNPIDGAKIGWIVCGTVNAKNRMGGYVGAKPFVVVISKDAVIHREIDTPTAARCPAGG